MGCYECYGYMDGVTSMRMFFGKDLRQPICDAFKIICSYLDNTFDITVVTKSAYETRLENNTNRIHTLYAMTDQKYTSYSGRFTICNVLEGAYMGSVELQNGILEDRLFFEKEVS